MHRFTTQQGIEFIKKFEGFSAKPYYCVGGYLTIGYGHKILKQEFSNDSLLSEELAEEILRYDLLKVERAILRHINVSLTDNQFDALVSFTFNLGSAALQRSSLRHKVNYQLYKEAASEFLRWVYAGGKRINGLIRRRHAESKLFLT